MKLVIKNDIKIRDWLLIIGTIIAPMNYYRIWKIGPGEILCFLWCIRYIFSFLKVAKDDFYYKFWIFFIISIFLGSTVSFIFYPDELRVIEILTYFYLQFISLGVFWGLKKKSIKNIESIFKYICYLSSFWYIFLYIYSIYFSNTFLGAPLWYGQGLRFSGGADNPHHLATLMSAVIFGNIYFIVTNKRTIIKKAIPIISLMFSLIVAFETESSTLLASLVVGLAIGIFFCFINMFKLKKHKIVFTIIIISTIIIFSMLNYNNIIGIFKAFIRSDVNGVFRIELFKSVKVPFIKSPIFGLGPGIHGYSRLDGHAELHNMYLEILAMSGLIGLAIFLQFSFNLFKKMYKTPLLFSCIVSLYVYGLAGFTFRKLVFWITISILLNLSIKIQSTTKEKKI